MPPRPRNKRTMAEIADDAAKKIKSFQIADDADVVLAPCRKLRAALALRQEQQQQQQQQPLTTGSIVDSSATTLATTATTMTTATTKTTVRDDIVEVSELTTSQVMDGMEVIALQIATQVLQKQGFQMEIPSRASSNQVYIAEWDRIVLGNKTGIRSFLNVKVWSMERGAWSLEYDCSLFCHFICHVLAIALLLPSFPWICSERILPVRTHHHRRRHRHPLPPRNQENQQLRSAYCNYCTTFWE